MVYWSISLLVDKQVSGKALNFYRQDWKVLPIGDRRDIPVPLISAKVEDHFQNLLWFLSISYSSVHALAEYA